ncbi:MAG TPA: aminodeoxychorismate synthase component I [Terracidiphilus sp.]|nr:aminodeoxychorismate synthase component I [Terracidiphilus sp.]
MSRRHSLPAEVYALVEHTPATALLECGKPNTTETHAESCTRIFTAPLRVCVANNAVEIAGLFREIESAVAAGQTAVGFFTYECGNCFEPKAGMRASQDGQPLAPPLAWIGIYERGYLFDHATGAFPEGEPPGLESFRRSQDEPPKDSSIEAALGLTEAQYAERIAAIHEWIRAGDVYQLNFTVPYSVRVRGSVAALYARLRERQPVEYGAFVHWEAGRRILSFSPELFFRVDEESGGRRITTKPMKGTAARGRTTREDRKRAEWLRNDPKNRSENVMIVDLLRNDLGRLAKFGSVHAEKLFAVERYPTLWQMTSTVTGELRAEVGFHEIFRALFPCGSVTGAPKVRAMQLLAELEEQPRGVYTGAIGYFSQRRTVFNVAIRTLELDGESGTMGVGSGIVIDSDAAEECGECVLKAEFLTGSASRFPERFSLAETMLWDNGYPLLELHLDRLQDSAEYFEFECERDAVRNALMEHARAFEGTGPRRVRLLVDSDGRMNIGDEPLVKSGGGDAKAVRACISRERTDAKDPMLYHKTTHRRLYTEAFKEAVNRGFDDVLFMNCAGEITEGAISNVFIEKAGRWLTPPVECGLLAGVYRRHLLETLAGAEERVLHAEDLRKADAVYLCNAVRGLRRVTIEWEG